MRSWPWIRTRYQSEDELTTDADRELMDVNHADVTYKVVYKKNKRTRVRIQRHQDGRRLRYGP